MEALSQRKWRWEERSKRNKVKVNEVKKVDKVQKEQAWYFL